jgi:hypothetical protein
MAGVNIELIKRYRLLFETIEEGSPEWLVHNNETQATFSFDSDFEQKPHYLFHLDAGMTVHRKASLITRSTFAIDYDGPFENLFVPTATVPMVKAAYEVCLNEMKNQCAAQKIPYEVKVELGDEFYQSFSRQMIDYYVNTRKDEDLHNSKLRDDEFLSFSPGNKIMLLVNGTYIITDEVLFLNPLFNRKHNVLNFLPAAQYHTVKLKCREAVTKEVKLNGYDSTFFLLCVDLALQMLIGDFADVLMPALVRHGLHAEAQKQYIEYANGFISSVNAKLKENGARIDVLAERKDWNSIIQLA